MSLNAAAAKWFDQHPEQWAELVALAESQIIIGQRMPFEYAGRSWAIAQWLPSCCPTLDLLD